MFCRTEQLRTVGVFASVLFQLSIFEGAVDTGPLSNYDNRDFTDTRSRVNRVS